MYLEGIILHEISHWKTNGLCYHLHAESKKMKHMNITKKQTNITNRNGLTENKLIITSGEREMGRDNLGVGD